MIQQATSMIGLLDALLDAVSLGSFSVPDPCLGNSIANMLIPGQRHDD